MELWFQKNIVKTYNNKILSVSTPLSLVNSSTTAPIAVSRSLSVWPQRNSILVLRFSWNCVILRLILCWQLEKRSNTFFSWIHFLSSTITKCSWGNKKSITRCCSNSLSASSRFVMPPWISQLANMDCMKLWKNMNARRWTTWRMPPTETCRCLEKELHRHQYPPLKANKLDMTTIITIFPPLYMMFCENSANAINGIIKTIWSPWAFPPSSFKTESLENMKVTATGVIAFAPAWDAALATIMVPEIAILFPLSLYVKRFAQPRAVPLHYEEFWGWRHADYFPQLLCL